MRLRMQRMRWLTLVLVAAGCGGEPMNVVGTGASTTLNVGPAGGQISLEGATLMIPAGALATPVDIKLTSTTFDLQPYQTLSPLYWFEPENLQLAQPATLTITSPKDIGDAMLMSTVHAGGRSVTWLQDLQGSVSGQSMTGQMFHFSGVGIEHLPPCDDAQSGGPSDQEYTTLCKLHKCGKFPVREHEAFGNTGNAVLFAGIAFLNDECILDCGPCDGGAASPGTSVSFSGNIGIDNFSTSSLDSIGCNASSFSFNDAPISVNGASFHWGNDWADPSGHKFDWGLDSTKTTLSMDGEVIYQAGVTLDTQFELLYGGDIPPTEMMPVSNKVSGSVMVAGRVSCTEPTVPTPDMGVGDMASNGGPPQVNDWNPKFGPTGTTITVTGQGLTDVTDVLAVFSDTSLGMASLPFKLVDDSTITVMVNVSRNFILTAKVTNGSMNEQVPIATVPFAMPPTITSVTISMISDCLPGDACNFVVAGTNFATYDSATSKTSTKVYLNGTADGESNGDMDTQVFGMFPIGIATANNQIKVTTPAGTASWP
jgi:hypothetical protein